LARIEAVSRSLSPGNIVAAGMIEKELKRREPPFRCDLEIVLESAFKAAKQLSSKTDGVSCQIAKGHWAVKLAWLDRIAKETENNADGDGGDDDHKHTFIVEGTPTIATGVEGLICVKGIQVTTGSGDGARPCRFLSRRHNARLFVRRTAPSCARTFPASRRTTDLIIVRVVPAVRR